MAIDFSKGPLTGTRVLDLTSVIMGPYATHLMADLGADVIKVEAPEGDQVRHYRPLRNPAMSGMFMNLNRNKRSVVLDLKKPSGQRALKRLIKTADVFVHSLRPDTINGLGFSYETVRAINPEIIYCGAYGFGARGPYSHKAAYDDVIQAGSGIAGLFARLNGVPSYAPTVICDKIGGQTIAHSVMAALVQRARGGGGMSIEVPMLETLIEFIFIEHMYLGCFDPPLGKMGFPRLVTKSRKPFRTADGYMCLLPYSDRNWQDFFNFVDRTDCIGDARFATLPLRVQNIDVLYAIVDEVAVKHTNAEWVKFCDSVSIPAMPVLSLEELEHDPHVKEVGLFHYLEHPTEGKYRTVGRPTTLSTAEFSVYQHPPRLGEHSREILLAAGYTEDEYAALVHEGGTRADQVKGDTSAPTV